MASALLLELLLQPGEVVYTQVAEVFKEFAVLPAFAWGISLLFSSYSVVSAWSKDGLFTTVHNDKKTCFIKMRSV